MNPKHIRSKSLGNRILTVVLSAAAVFLAVLCVLSWMLLSDPNAGTPLQAPSDPVTSKVITAAVSGKDVNLSSEEVSAWLNLLIQRGQKNGEDAGLSGLDVTAKEDGSADVYLPVRSHGKTLGVLMNLVPSFDRNSEQIRLAVRSVRVGRLPIPTGLALNRMEQRLPSILSRQDNDLICNTESLFKVDYAGVSAQLKMTDVELKNQMFAVRLQLKLGLNG